MGFTNICPFSVSIGIRIRCHSRFLRVPRAGKAIGDDDKIHLEVIEQQHMLHVANLGTCSM